MKRSALVWIAARVRRRIPAIILTVALQTVHSLLAVYFALSTRGVIDSAVARDTPGFRRACLILGAVILGLLLCFVLVRGLRDRLAADLERDWKQKLFHGLLHGEYASVSAYHSGELLNRLNQDVARVNDGILGILPGVISMAVRLVAAVAVLGALAPGFTGLMILLGLCLMAAGGLIRRKLKELNKRVAEQDGRVWGFLQEHLEKLLPIQAMDVAGETERRGDQLLADRYELQRKRRKVSLLTGTGLNLVSFGASFLALVWCAGHILTGTMTFGSLTAVIQLVNQLQAPFVGLSGILPRYAALQASVERLQELEAIPQEPAPLEEATQALYERMESIRGEKLTFAYDRENVLENAEFSIEKGSFCVITGPSGIGKSTLLKLLLGIFRPEQGQLYLQGHGERVLLDRAARRLFAYVPQGHFLFSGTIRENLTITKPDATEEALLEAVRISGMEEDLLQLPLGLDTLLGENGQNLSEGQGQRLSIARAVLSGAPILLLDEGTSALDAQTEKRVLENLRSLNGRTVIAVTHRPAALEAANLQLHVENKAITTVRLR